MPAIDALVPDAHGWVPGARRVHSPHCDPRPEAMPIDLLVVHGISLPPGQFGGDAVEALFAGRLDCDTHPYFDRLRGLRVSAHFLIRRHGELVQFVSCALRAWHAGESRFGDRVRCNDFSIGVELEGTDEQPYEDPQYRRLVALVRGLRERYPLAHLAGHSDIAPGRKTDPGPSFDWPRVRRTLAGQGI